MARLLRAGHGKPPRGGDIKNLTNTKRYNLQKRDSNHMKIKMESLH